MSLSSEDKADFIKEITEIMDTSNAAGRTVYRRIQKAIHQGETYTVVELNEDENEYYQELINAAVSGQKQDLKLAVELLKGHRKCDDSLNESLTESPKKKKKNETDQNAEEKSQYMEVIDSIKNDTNLDEQGKMAKLTKHIDENESKIFRILSGKEITAMIKDTEKRILDGHLLAWEIKPALTRVEELKSMLSNLDVDESTSSATFLDKKDGVSLRIGQIDAAIFKKIMTFQFDFSKGALYTCKKCNKQFTTKKKASEHVATVELTYYNTFV